MIENNLSHNSGAKSTLYNVAVKVFPLSLHIFIRTCLFNKGFFTMYFRAKEKNAVTLPHSAQRKHAFIGKIKGMSKKNKLPARNNIALELLHQILGHRSNRSLLAGDTANAW